MHKSDEKHRVTWIPAHPGYGAVSMFRYWKSLQDAQGPDDRYQGRSVLGEAGEQSVDRQGKLRRQITRRVVYPLTVSARCRGGLAHVFDHSWADMLAYVPKSMATVVTVHDLIPLRFPGELTPAQQGRFRSWVEHLRVADLIISVSEYTKQETVELLNIDPQRIHVVANGVSVSDAAAADSAWIDGLLKKSAGGLKIGSLGSTLERKNLQVLPAALRAYAEAGGAVPTLVRAGELVPGELRRDLEAVLGADHFVELGFVSDRQLEAFFGAIDVMVVPSLYEGFGLPVIEAMARGVPVIAADASSLPEVGGGAALYFDPADADQLAHRLVEIATPDRRRQLVEAGRSRAAEFTWRASLQGCHRVYDAALELKANG